MNPTLSFALTQVYMINIVDVPMFEVMQKLNATEKLAKSTQKKLL